MASIKLNATIRDEIIANVMKDAFKSEKNMLQALVHEFSLRVYNTLYTAAEQDMMKKLPKDLFYMREEVNTSLKAKGERDVVNFKLEFKNAKILPLAFQYRYNCDIIVASELVSEADDLNKQAAAIKEREGELRSKVHGVVMAATTVQRLLETWPEAKPYIPKHILETKPSLPAVIVKELNATLAAALGKPLAA